MTLRPIHTIEINDERFKEFKKQFDEVKKSIDDQPEAWKRTNDQIRAIRDSYDKMRKMLRDQSDDTDDVSKKTQKVRDQTSAWLGSSLAVARSSYSVVKNTYKATQELEKWAKLTSVFSSLVGAGGLFGITRLAQGASDKRRTALGLGVSIGERSSFQTNFGRLGNTDGILNGFSEALSDVTKRQPLSSLGISPGKNAADTFAEALPKIKNLIDRTDPKNQRNVLGSYGLDQLGIDDRMANVIRRMSMDEIQQIIKDYRGNVNSLNIPDDIAKKWQDLQTQLLRSKSNIEKVIGDNLVHLTPGLTNLSNSIVDLVRVLMDEKNGPLAGPDGWLKKLDDALLKFAAEIGSNDTQDTMTSFIKKFDMTRQDFDVINMWISNHQGTIRALFGAAAGSAIGAYAGPVGAVVGAAVGAGVAAASHDDHPGEVERRRQEAVNHSRDAGQRQRAAGAAAERPTLQERNAERKGLGLPTYKNQEEYDKAEPAADSLQPGHGMTGLRSHKPVGDDAKPIPDAKPTPDVKPQASNSGGYDSDIAGDISGSSTYSRIGEKITPEAFVVHHTGSRGSVEGVQATLNQRRLGVQYIMDRDGKIYRALPEGNRAAHILPSEVKDLDLSNSNTFGMEVIAKDDADVTPAEVKAAVKFYHDIKQKYPSIKEAYGHGYLNPGHKQATEGKTITDAIYADERKKAPDSITPEQAGASAAKGVAVTNRGFMGSAYQGRDDRPHETIVHDHSAGEVKVEVTRQ